MTPSSFPMVREVNAQTKRTPTSERVCAVIVTFHPDAAGLARLVRAMAAETCCVFIVANDQSRPCFILPANAILHLPEINLGLGAAYNLAAQWAAGNGMTHLLLLDQDSIPAPGMLSILLKTIAVRNNAAAAGPLWRDSRTGVDGFFVRISRFGLHKFLPAKEEIAAVDFLISSGSLIALAALADIGPFDEKFFIEHVDTEWSLRARAKGYRLYGAAEARLDQEFGEQTITPSILGFKRRLYLYPPERNYYLLRNSIILWRKHYAPWPWILHDTRRVFMLMLFYALFVPPRWSRMKWMLKAVRDGWWFN